jgi:hypothetical protein
VDIPVTDKIEVYATAQKFTGQGYQCRSHVRYDKGEPKRRREEDAARILVNEKT